MGDLLLYFAAVRGSGYPHEDLWTGALTRCGGACLLLALGASR
jgi:hypothetical protein